MSQTKITNTRSAILAFYPRPTALGFAVMDSPTSVRASGYRYCPVEDVKSYLELISALIKLHNPTLVIVESKKSRKQYRGERMLDMFKKIEQYVVKKNHRLVHYSRKNIREHFGKIDKREVATRIGAQFPEYRNRIPRPRAEYDGSESPKMSEFDALSLCITHFSRNEIRKAP